MKNSDLSNAIGNVNLKYIEEMENYTAKRMSLTKIISLAACIAIIVTAIPVALVLNREDTNTDAPVVTILENEDDKDPNKIESNKFQNMVYCEADLASKEDLIKRAFANQKVEVNDVKSFKGLYSPFYIKHPLKMLESYINIPTKLSFTVGGTSFVANLESAYYGKGAEKIIDDELKAITKIAKYSIDTINGKKTQDHLCNEVYYCVTTQRIVLLRTEDMPYFTEAQLSEKELWDIVEKDITSLYGKDFLKKYSYSYSSRYREPTAIDEGGWDYYVEFVRNFGEFKSNEKVVLKYNGDGQLYQLVTENLGVFDSIESQFTEDVLEEVDEKAIKLSEGGLIKSKKMIMNDRGEVYAYYVYYLKEGDKDSSTRTEGNFYIKININK